MSSLLSLLQLGLDVLVGENAVRRVVRSESGRRVALWHVQDDVEGEAALGLGLLWAHDLWSNRGQKRDTEQKRSINHQSSSSTNGRTNDGRPGMHSRNDIYRLQTFSSSV